MNHNAGTSKPASAKAPGIWFAARVLLVALLSFALAQRAAEARENPHSARAGKYIVRWHRTNSPGGSGDVIEAFRAVRVKQTGIVVLHRVYRYLTSEHGTWVCGVSPWKGQHVKRGHRCTGVMITMEYGAGSGKDFMILADTRKGFREVLHIFQHKVKDGESLEVVRLDRDRFPELICISEYDQLPTAINPRVAQVWKWNRKKEQYDMVRESPYKDRLKLLKDKP